MDLNLTAAELHLSTIYTDAFTNKRNWTPEDHLAGLKAVYAAGADAQKRKEATEEV